MCANFTDKWSLRAVPSFDLYALITTNGPIIELWRIYIIQMPMRDAVHVIIAPKYVSVSVSVKDVPR